MILSLFFIFNKNTGNFINGKNDQSSNSLGIYLMSCKAKNYDFGKKFHLINLKVNNQEVDSSKKYAEYWMGSDINDPDEILVNGKFIPLKEYLKESQL